MFCETEEVNKIRCDSPMPAGVVFDMGKRYLYGDFWLKIMVKQQLLVQQLTLDYGTAFRC